jgi:hypothetical protein
MGGANSHLRSVREYAVDPIDEHACRWLRSIISDCCEELRVDVKSKKNLKTTARLRTFYGISEFSPPLGLPGILLEFGIGIALGAAVGSSRGRAIGLFGAFYT